MISKATTFASLVIAIAVAGACGKIEMQGTPGATTEESSCPCGEGWVCCPNGTSCVPPGKPCPASKTGTDTEPSPSPPPPPDDPGPPKPASGVTTVAVVAKAVHVACSPNDIYAATTDGKIFVVPLATKVPVPLSPPPSGIVGGLAWSGGKLLYTLPAEGEVRVRDLATGDEVRLASGQAKPQGIVQSGDDVLFTTATTVARVAPTGSDQTPATRVTFTGQFPDRGPGIAIAVGGSNTVVSHESVDPIATTGVLATYKADGEQIRAWGFFSNPIGVATSLATARTYWSESSDMISHGPLPLPVGSLATVAVATGQAKIGDICLEGGRLYFTATNDDDLREIRSVGVE